MISQMNKSWGYYVNDKVNQLLKSYQNMLTNRQVFWFKSRRLQLKVSSVQDRFFWNELDHEDTVITSALITDETWANHVWLEIVHRWGVAFESLSLSPHISFLCLLSGWQMMRVCSPLSSQHPVSAFSQVTVEWLPKTTSKIKAD